MPLTSRWQSCQQFAALLKFARVQASLQIRAENRKKLFMLRTLRFDYPQSLAAMTPAFFLPPLTLNSWCQFEGKKLKSCLWPITTITYQQLLLQLLLHANSSATRIKQNRDEVKLTLGCWPSFIVELEDVEMRRAIETNGKTWANLCASWWFYARSELS